MMEVLSYGIGTLIAFAIFLAVAFVFISDITQNMMYPYPEPKARIKAA